MRRQLKARGSAIVAAFVILLVGGSLVSGASHPVPPTPPLGFTAGPTPTPIAGLPKHG